MIYHMVPADFWNRSAENTYQSETFEDEGFIHFSKSPEQLLRVANRLYISDPDPYLILCVDETAVDAELRHETVDEEEFPHLFGVLNRDAVEEVIVFPREEDGTFVLPDDLK